MLQMCQAELWGAFFTRISQVYTTHLDFQGYSTFPDTSDSGRNKYSSKQIYRHFLISISAVKELGMLKCAETWTLGVVTTKLKERNKPMQEPAHVVPGREKQN